MKNDLVYNEGAIVSVTKEFTFDSCHQLKAYVGPCERLHGHTYRLQVTVEGNLSFNGMVMDFKDLKCMVEGLVKEPLDHYNLNDKLWFNTTAENMSVYFFDMLSKEILTLSAKEGRYIKLKEVKLWETPTSFATYRGVK